MAISGGDGSIILTTKIDESGLNDGLKSLRTGVLNFEKALKGVAVAGAGAFAAHLLRRCALHTLVVRWRRRCVCSRCCRAV